MSDTSSNNVNFDDNSEPTLAETLFKTATINAAATAGTLVGLVAIGLSVDKVREFRTKRALKKAAEQPVVPSTTE